MKNRHNFHLATKADFNFAEVPGRMPDYVSESGSMYWYEESRLIRMSDHWGDVASCRWTLNGNRAPQFEYGYYACGQVDWDQIQDRDPLKAYRIGYDQAMELVGQVVDYGCPKRVSCRAKGKVLRVDPVKGLKIGRHWMALNDVLNPKKYEHLFYGNGN